MTQISEILKVLQDWKKQPAKHITTALTHLNNARKIQGRDLDDALKGLIDFHRQVSKCDESLIGDPKWFELCINSKKKLKKLQEAAERNKRNQPILELKKKQALQIDYPAELTVGRVPADEKILKCLYKSFVANFQEALKNPKTVQFIISAFKEIKYKFDDKLDGTLNKKILSISTRLAKQGSKQSKKKMLKGEITAKELANDDQELYFDQKTKENIKRIQTAELQKSRTGFYDDMKKQLNKDASQECKFCHQKTAYCEDQKQIRASDEPMTRFMRCNACEKTWTN